MSYFIIRACKMLFCSLGIHAFCLFPAASFSIAAATLAVASEDGYAGNVLDRLVARWPASIQLKPGEKIHLLLSVDENGQFAGCHVNGVATGTSQSVCAAAKAAAPFGQPPYGLATDINLVLWNMPANSSGTEHASPATSAASHAKDQPASANRTQDDPRYAKYISRATWKLRNSMYIPAQTARGTYHLTARIKFDKQGKILESAIVKGSGDELLDKYALQGIKRAGSIAAPPEGLGNTLDLRFKLDR